MLELDFSITTSEQRNKFVSTFFENNPNYIPTKKELETLTNYILYGKDENGTSVVDRHEVEIDSKYNSYKKRTPESLDELIETPGFNENTITTNNIYKKVKPTIDREKDSNIPNIQELWKEIDRVEELLKTELNDKEEYLLKHYLIELRTQQYYLKDSHKPYEHLYNSNVHKDLHILTDEIDWDLYYFYPLGLYCGQTERFRCKEAVQGGRSINSDLRRVLQFDVKRDLGELQEQYEGRVIDFTNPEHIYILLKNYGDLVADGEKDVEQTSNLIVKTLEFYIAAAALDDVKKFILYSKMRGAHNAIIRKGLEQFGVDHNENYISTIFKKGICEDIAAAALLNYHEFLNRDNMENWKVCKQCGRRQLLDTRTFTRKSKSSDGFAGKCKQCERENRKMRKEGSK